ncbi:MAG: DUF2232 domain-containing protein [Elusimicrobia bacterium]|nr:DUF2232 domain-containing protein [Elusimicrobiota bacterium]
MTENQFPLIHTYRLLAGLIFASIVLFWPPMTFLAIVPLLLLSCIRGTRYAVIGTLLAALAIWLISGITLLSLMFLLVAGIPALVMGTLIKKDTAAWDTIALVAALLLVCLVLIVVILEQVGQLNFWLELQRIFRDSMDQAYQFYKNRGVGTEELSRLKRNSWQLLRMIDLIWPSLMVITIWVFVSLDYIISGQIVRRFGLTIKSLPVFNQWRCSDWLVWGFIISSGVLVGDQVLRVSTIRWLYAGLVNILILIGFAYFIQGLSITNYYFHKAKVGKLPQGLCYLLLALNRELWIVLLLFGMVDIWVDFRKINKAVASN